MNTTTDRGTTRATGWVRARHVATLSVAGVLAGLALAPTGALAAHSTSEGGGTPTPSGDKWSYMYDVAQRKEAMAQDRVEHADVTSSETGASGPQYTNAWSYMYSVEGSRQQRGHGAIPAAKARHDSYTQRKGHPALARIVVSVTRSGPATCYLPDTVDPATRRLIAVQLCGKAHIVPAVFVARAAYSLGHV